MIQPLFFNYSNASQNGVNGMFSSISNNVAAGSQGLRRCVWPTAGVFNNLALVLESAPGVGNSVTITLRTGTNAAPSNTALTVTISGTDTVGQITVTDVSISAGDTIDFLFNTTGSPASTISASVALEFVPTSGNKSAHTSNVGGLQTCFIGAFSMIENASLQSFQQQYVATPGNVTALAAASMFANVNANPLDFYINKNGVRQDGTGGTVDTKCSLVSVSTNVAVIKTFTLPVVAGDILYIETVETGTFSGNWVSCGLEFTADNPGCSNLGAHTDSTVSASVTNYSNLNDNDLFSWSTTVDGTFLMRRRGTITPFQFTALYGKVETDPGAAPNSRTFTARVNGNDTSLAGTVTTGNLTYSATGSAPVTQGQIMSMKHVPADTPTVTGDSTWTLAIDTTKTSLISQVAIEMISLVPPTDPWISQVAVEMISYVPVTAVEKTRFFLVVG